MANKLVMPENKLKKKAGNGGFKESDLIRAQDVIEKNEVDFVPLATDLINQLSQTLNDIKTGTILPEKYFDEIMYPLMQLKAQGSLFRYPLITRISHIIIDFLENIPVVDEDALEIIQAYQKSLQAILALEIKTDDNPAGRDLCAALIAACGRYAKAMEKRKNA